MSLYMYASYISSVRLYPGVHRRVSSLSSEVKSIADGEVVYPCAALDSQHRYLLPVEGLQKDVVLPVELFAKADAAPAKADTPSIVEIAEDEVVVVQGVVRLPPKVRIDTFSYVCIS
jgi:hypothetical protein